VLSFDEIVHMVFKKIEPKRNLRPLEKAARGELKFLLNEVESGRLPKDKASEAKEKLKNKYNECLKHFEYLDLLENRILKACWDFKNSDKYINTLLEDLGAIADIPEVKTGYELYGDIAFAVAEYFDKKLKPNDKWKTYRSEMDRLKYLVSSAQKGQIKLEEQNALEQQRKKVMSVFMEYAFNRISRGMPMRDAKAELLLDMPSLWNMALDMAEAGEGEKIDTLLIGMKALYDSLNKIT